MLKLFQAMYRSDSDYLNKTVLLFFFACRQGKKGLREGGTRGTLYPGLIGSGAREDKRTHVKIFCDQAQIDGRILHLQHWKFNHFPS